MSDNLHELHVVVDEVSFSQGDRCIFDNISLTIPRGKITAIMGPSGTGKTTLLRLISAQLAPDMGNIWVDGIDLHQLSQKALFRARQNMSMLFQSAALFTDLTVFENVAFPLREHSQLPEDIIRTIVLLKLQMVGLRGARDLYPGALSGGMGRRVALARAMAFDPQLMLYDEPFAGQDPISMGVLVQLIKQVNRTLGTTSIIVSHDVPETMAISDHVYIISDGNIIAQGTPDAMRNNQTPAVTQFIQGLADGSVPFHYPAAPLDKDLLC